ncbi:hypothetical protein EW145_g6862 [Phellinidium pouzarii]|uniref:NADP-dependent oxidoreductase domain-containing protein n=1 Tax=Phellinidium pouzarii TaxID=167371 RepID=A0A4S4KSU9_9AGAM|nr:hypothetical protein EW145_g6862 [Phellinidium pouzarii]
MPWETLTLNDGATMPSIAFGTWTLGNGQSVIDQVDQALNVGFEHIDTAQSYRNEVEAGQAFKESGLSRSDLGVSYVDLYLIHSPRLANPDIPTVWAQMEKVKSDGLAKSIGISNFGVAETEVLLASAKIKPAVNQILFHPYVYAQQAAIVEAAKKDGIVIEAYSLLSPITRQPGGPLDKPLAQIGERLGATADQVLMAWAKAKGVVVVTTSSKESRLKGYLSAADLNLTSADISDIDIAGTIGTRRLASRTFIRRLAAVAVLQLNGLEVMDRSSDTTTLSPTPFSPFSSAYSCGSEGGTSDEPADLGQLAAVFEVLRTEFQPRTQLPTIPRTGTPTSSLLVSPSDGEDGPSTTWSRTDSLAYSDYSDGEYGENGDENAGSGPGDGSALDQPSLGYLDGVLGFSSRRAREACCTAGRPVRVGGASSQSQASTSESAWRHVIEPRRKRRRKRGRQHGTGTTSASGTHTDNGPDVDAEGAATPVGDTLDGSSSGERWSHGKSMPSTPPQGTSRSLRRGKGTEPTTVTIPGTSSTIPLHPKLSHSRSTPSLRVMIPTPPDARVLRLRTLATKLRMLFVEDARTLSSVLLNDIPEADGFIDPRGRPPEGDDSPIHVFVDHSNILIGFLNHLRRFPIHGLRPGPTHLSHIALALVLERGRPVSRRVLATSSPLYQPMEGAERLGYEVRVYARVPDLGDGADRVKAKRNVSSNTNGDSDPGPPMAIPNAGISHSNSYTRVHGTTRGRDHSRSTSLTLPTYAHASPGMSANPGGRIRFREQGVDELLQLKLHQVLADADSPPPYGATIVLATGDGNAGQFNADGFRGAVRTALRKGWRVELYAWEYGLSRAWAKEFGNGGGSGSGSDAHGKAGIGGENPYGDRFKIVGLEKFASDLLEL